MEDKGVTIKAKNHANDNVYPWDLYIGLQRREDGKFALGSLTIENFIKRLTSDIDNSLLTRDDACERIMYISNIVGTICDSYPDSIEKKWLRKSIHRCASLSCQKNIQAFKFSKLFDDLSEAYRSSLWSDGPSPSPR